MRVAREVNVRLQWQSFAEDVGKVRESGVACRLFNGEAFKDLPCDVGADKAWQADQLKFSAVDVQTLPPAIEKSDARAFELGGQAVLVVIPDHAEDPVRRAELGDEAMGEGPHGCGCACY